MGSPLSMNTAAFIGDISKKPNRRPSTVQGGSVSRPSLPVVSVRKSFNHLLPIYI